MHSGEDGEFGALAQNLVVMVRKFESGNAIILYSGLEGDFVLDNPHK